jgi:hypothetical protein
MSELLRTLRPEHRRYAVAFSIVAFYVILPSQLAAISGITTLGGVAAIRFGPMWGSVALVGGLAIAPVVWNVDVRIPRKSDIESATANQCLSA